MIQARDTFEWYLIGRMDETLTGSVRFSYRAYVKFGDSVKVVGSCASLGAWNAAEGVSLTTSEKTHPVWTTARSIALPLNQTIEYKYAILHHGRYSWESLPHNRSITVSHRTILLEDSELSHTSKEFINDPTHVQKSLSRTQTPPFKPFNESEKFEKSDAVIIVSLQLPITVSIDEGYRADRPRQEKFVLEDRTEQWLPVLRLITEREGLKVKWVGGLPLELADQEDREVLSAVLRRRYNCEPVYLPNKLAAGHAQYSNQIIFPVFHNIISTDPDHIPQYSLEKWDSFRLVNSRFADKVMEIYTGEELIWVNDFPLLLVPSFLSRRTREPLNIGLYLHIPFPSSEMFRVIPHREAILHGMLCCDLIGFHLFEYARHFLTCCKRLLGVDHRCSQGGFLGLEFYGRYVMLRVGFAGIDPQSLQAKGEAGKELAQRLSEQYRDKVVLLGLDSLHRFSGITLKMNAFRELMSELKPKEREKVVFLQVLTPSRYCDEVDIVRSEILELNRKITQECGREMIQLIEKDLTTAERLAYFQASSALIITSIRDGLNVCPFEYVAVKGAAKGTVILSDFAGVSLALCSPIRVNPFDIHALKEALFNVIMNNSFQPLLRQKDLKFVTTHTILHWTEGFLSDIKKARKQEKRFQYVVHGCGDRVKLVALRKRLTYLIGEDLLEDYKKSRCRAFFFDSEGTLSGFLKAPDPIQTAKYAKNLLILDELSKDERNNIFIVSGRERNLLQAYYSSVKHVGIAAEHGAFIKMSHEDNWELIPTIQSPWKDAALDTIMGYVARTEGAACETKETSVVFQHRNADPEYGDWQAKELTTQLDIMMRPYLDECQVSSGTGYVEVRPRGVSKGTALRELCKRVSTRKGEIDFIMAVGDDVNDEEMFAEIKALKNEASPYFLPNTLKVVTCTIGKKPTKAKFYINDGSDLTHVLDLLRTSSVKVSGKQTSKYYSHSDLRSLAHSTALGREVRNSFGVGTGRTTSMIFDETSEDDQQYLT